MGPHGPADCNLKASAVPRQSSSRDDYRERNTSVMRCSKLYISCRVQENLWEHSREASQKSGQARNLLKRCSSGNTYKIEINQYQGVW